MARRKKHPIFQKNSLLMNPMQQKNTRNALLIAALITFALYFVPYAGIVTYPLRLMVTFIHEGCHALVALLTGGNVQRIAIQPDGSGVTSTSGGFAILIASAGYLGATAYGTMLLSLLRRGTQPRNLLFATSAIIGLLTLLFVRPFDNFFGFVWGIGLTFLLGGLAVYLPTNVAAWIGAFIGIECVMNALFDLKTLLNIAVFAGNTPSDAYNMQSLTLIPAAVWAVVWIGIAVWMLWVVLIVPTLQTGRSRRARTAKSWGS